MGVRKFIDALVLCLLLGAVGAPALAYQHNYTCGDEGLGECEEGHSPQPIVWEETCIVFEMDESGPSGVPLGDDDRAASEVEKVVERSFSTWAEPDCSGVAFEYAGMVDPDRELPGDIRHTVRFLDEEWPESSSTTFATTPVSYSPESGVIIDADIEVNDQFYSYSVGGAPEADEADLQNVLTHEVGHLLGISHSDVEEATMYGGAELGETNKRELHGDDIEGLCDYYGRDEYRATCSDSETQGDDEDWSDGDDGLNWGEDDEDGDAPGCASLAASTGGGASSTAVILTLLGALWWRVKRRHSNGS